MIGCSRAIMRTGMVTVDFANCGTIWVHEKRCIRYTYSKTHCRRCEDICLVDAIRFKPEASVDRNLCFNCGLCYTACEFSAIGIQKDNRVFIETIRDADSIEIGCIFAESEIKVACLSRLSEDLLFWMFANGKRVVLNRGFCRSCKFHDTLKYFYTELRLAVKAAKAAGVQVNLKIQTKRAKEVYIPRQSLSRRNIFSSIRLARKAAGTVKKREIFCQSLAAVGVKNNLLYPRAATIEIGQECNLCGVCEHVCAADAILIKKSDEGGAIYFDPASCIGCKQCEDSCLYGALIVDQAPISSVLSKPRKVFEAYKRKCEACGKEFFSSDDKHLCSACRAREEGKNQFLEFLKNL